MSITAVHTDGPAPVEFTAVASIAVQHDTISPMAARSRSAEPSPTGPRLLPVGRSPLARRCADALFSACGVTSGQSILIALSGGADSTALLLLLNAIARRRSGPRITLAAAHVHHHLRDSADDDLAHVEHLCRQLKTPLFVRHIHPRTTPGNLAAASRQLRYRALADVAMENGASFIATAHHADDQAETVLMNLARGASWRGLAAISWQRPLTPALQLIRPLLELRKRECEQLCRAAGASWCDDPTNARLDAPRTRLRHDILPALDSLWPGASLRIAALAADARDIDHFLQSFSAQLLPDPPPWRRDDLRKLPSFILAHALFHAAAECSSDGEPLDRARITQAVDAIRDTTSRPRRFTWPNRFTLTVTARQVDLRRRER